ncbi:hypothetical protein [Streptomyces macrosporus]|uniref:Uncharacterized protein n=1 Tax=Streptomyces macrosporus TaxID=44032 RepID=A0ABP5WLD9_9ACTN
MQADRAPTPLPPLSRAEPSYPKKPLPKDREPEPLTAEEDRRVRTDGDLRDLLLPAPEGAREDEGLPALDGGWVPVDDYTGLYEEDEHDGLRQTVILQARLLG